MRGWRWYGMIALSVLAFVAVTVALEYAGGRVGLSRAVTGWSSLSGLFAAFALVLTGRWRYIALSLVPIPAVGAAVTYGGELLGLSYPVMWLLSGLSFGVAVAMVFSLWRV